MISNQTKVYRTFEILTVGACLQRSRQFATSLSVDVRSDLDARVEALVVHVSLAIDRRVDLWSPWRPHCSAFQLAKIS